MSNPDKCPHARLRSARVAVIGAGLSGLACANALTERGFRVNVFDKGRAPGGRTSTRRAEMHGFDHGAQYFTVRDPKLAELVALRSAQEWGVIEVVPTIKWMKAPRADFDFLDFEEAERLFDATVPEYRPMVATALKAGLRLGELLALRQTDVDLVNGQIFVKRSVWKRTFGTPKNGLSRRVPIPPSLVRILRDHRHLRGELVFCQEDGALLTRDMVKRVLPRACRRAGLDRTIQWHVLRHTFASHLVMRGEPLKVVQELLGHANIEATMIYAYLSESRLKQAVAKLDEPAPRPAADGHYLVTRDRRSR